MKLGKEKAKLGEILIKRGLITSEDLDDALWLQNSFLTLNPKLKSSEINVMLSVGDVSRLLNVHRNTVRRWAKNGIIRSCRINNRGDRRFYREDISRLMSEQTDIKSYGETDNLSH